MNYTLIEEETEEDGSQLLLMDKLLRLRNILETETFEPKDVPEDLLTQMSQLKEDYLNLLNEVIVGYSNLNLKKEKVSVLSNFIDKFGNKTSKYIHEIISLVDQFEEDERIDEIAKELKSKSERLLGMKKVFELCKDCDLLSKYMCFLCLDNTIDTFIDPCGHVVCNTCSQRSLSLCPFCRVRVFQFKKMFIH
jgi:Prokaryotic RING finger family 4